MIKKKTALGCVAALLYSILVSASVAAADFNLKLHHLLPAPSYAQKTMLEPWAKEIEERTGGRVKIEIYPAMSLGGKPPQLVKQVRDGVVDIVWTVNGYTPGLFPKTEVFELPFIHTNNPTATNLAMRDMFDKHLADEYRGTKVMFLHVHQGQAFQMVDTVIRTPADAAGLKLRIPTRTGSWVIEALGAAPTAMPVPALPQALSKKVVDGALIPWEIIPPLKLWDLTKYQIEGDNGVRFGTTTFQLSMNENTWNSLPADIQAVIESVNRVAWEKYGKAWAANDKAGIELAKTKGSTHIVLSASETAAFKTALEPVVDRWVKEVGEKGIDGAGLVKEARALVNKYQFTK